MQFSSRELFLLVTVFGVSTGMGRIGGWTWFVFVLFLVATLSVLSGSLHLLPLLPHNVRSIDRT